jgi:hypothetical protein
VNGCSAAAATPLLQTPAIDDIADQIEIVGLDMLQKIQQTVRLAARRAQMEVGDEDAPVPLGRRSDPERS